MSQLIPTTPSTTAGTLPAPLDSNSFDQLLNDWKKIVYEEEKQFLEHAKILKINLEKCFS